MSLSKQIFTLFAAAILLGLGTRVVRQDNTPFWGFPKPIELIKPQVSIAADNLTETDSAFVAADKPYEINLASAMVLYMKRAKNNVHFVDARDSTLFNAGHIPGALNISFDHIDKEVDKLYALPKEGLLVLYCDGGDCHLSHDLAEFALAEGYRRIAVYPGGWAEWSKETDMIEKVETPPTETK